MSFPVDISDPTRFFTTPHNPNIPPPPRANHLPMSSQPTSSPIKPPASSSSQVRHLLSPTTGGSASASGSRRTPLGEVDVDMLRPGALGEMHEYEEEDGDENGEEEDEEDEFAGMEMMTATQWIREVPASSSRGSRSEIRSERASSGLDPESDMLHHHHEPDDDHSSSWRRRGSPSRLFSSQQTYDYMQLSPALRTPAASHSLSDPTTLGAPITPITPDTDAHETPISWSPSPLSSRGKSRHFPGGSKPLVAASDSDDEEDDESGLFDKENISPERPERTRNSSPLLMARTTVKVGGGGRRIIDSDDEEVLTRSIKKNKGKGKERDIQLPLDVLEIDLDDVDEPQEDTCLTTIVSQPKLGTQYDTFDDAAFADIDLDFVLPEPGATENSNKTPRTHPPADDSYYEHAYNADPRPASIMPTRQTRPTAGNSILDQLDTDRIGNLSLTFIKDLEPRLQEFYNEHWRRGADKEKKRASRLSESDEEEEEESRRAEPARKRAAPAKRGSGWRRGWRGRARGVARRKR